MAVLGLKLVFPWDLRLRHRCCQSNSNSNNRDINCDDFSIQKKERKRQEEAKFSFFIKAHS